MESGEDGACQGRVLSGSSGTRITRMEFEATVVRIFKGERYVLSSFVLIRFIK
jgi:hypothetical protein